MGMKSAFSSGLADFSGIDGVKDLYISRVIHKTYINLDEKGTEAAAVTAVEIGNSLSIDSLPHVTEYFVVDRPFIYAITEKSTGAVIIYV
jgi:serpin B